MTRLLAVCLAVSVAVASPIAQTQKYGVTVTTDRKADFTKLKSYMWEKGWPSYDKTVHQQVVDAVDRELKGLGLEKRESDAADVMVTYATVRRTDVDLKSKPPTKNSQGTEYPVGTLVVLMREPGTGKELLRGKVDKPIELSPDKIGAVIDGVVSEIFAKYPTRAKR
jgi:hypothetical protein